MAVCSIDGTELSTLGFKLEGDSGFEDGVDAAFPVLGTSGMVGQIIASIRPTYAPRKGSLTLYIQKDTLSDLQTALDSLKGILVASGVALRSSVRPSRKITVRLDGAPKIGVVGSQGAKYIGPFGWRASVPVIADDPFWTEEADVTTGSITTSYVAIPTGTGPTWLDVDVTGPATNPVITLADYNSVAKLSASPVITIASGDVLRISYSQHNVQKRVSGVWTNAWDVMPIGFDFFEAREAWFRFASSSWVKMKTTTGTLSVTRPMRYK